MAETNEQTSIKEKLGTRLWGALQSAEQVLNENGDLKYDGGRDQACGLSSELVQHFLKQQGVHAKVIDTRFLCACASGQLPTEIEALQIELSNQNPTKTQSFEQMLSQVDGFFRHTVAVFQHDQSWYLVDFAFCQFVKQTSREICEGSDKSGYDMTDTLAQSLYADGIVELTPLTLRRYTDFMSNQIGKEKLNKGTNKIEVNTIITGTPDSPPLFEDPLELEKWIKRIHTVAELAIWFKTNLPTYGLTQLKTWATNRNFDQNDILKAIQLSQTNN